jgi:hypothetical protein
VHVDGVGFCVWCTMHAACYMHCAVVTGSSKAGRHTNLSDLDFGDWVLSFSACMFTLECGVDLPHDPILQIASTSNQSTNSYYQQPQSPSQVLLTVPRDYPLHLTTPPHRLPHLHSKYPSTPHTSRHIPLPLPQNSIVQTPLSRNAN